MATNRRIVLLFSVIYLIQSSNYSEKLLQVVLFVWQTVVSRFYSKEDNNEVDRYVEELEVQ